MNKQYGFDLIAYMCILIFLKIIGLPLVDRLTIFAMFVIGYNLIMSLLFTEEEKVRE